jgi:hypothetical protein
MHDLTAPVRLWRQLLAPFALVLTQPGFARFAQWVTGTILAWEEHTVTQLLTALGLEDRWRVVRPCLDKAEGRRIDVVTRLRLDARLFSPPPPAPARGPGRPRLWGERLPAPKDHDRWGRPWQSAAAYLYGRERATRFKELPCRWAVTGAAEPVRAFVFEVEGYEKPWSLVTTSATLTPAGVVSAFAARFRQEDGFRDHKQRLGMEECRAWTKMPVQRTFAVQVVAQTLLRLLSRRLDADPGIGRWWSPPDWNRGKAHPSVLDVRRAVWRSRAEFARFLGWLDGQQESPWEARIPSNVAP